MAALVWWVVQGSTAVQGQNITEAFSYTANTSIGNYTGWSVPQGEGMMSIQYARSGRALRLVGGLETEVRRTLGGVAGANVLYVDLWIRPVVYDNSFQTAIFLDGSVLGFIKDGPEGRIYVSDGATSGGAENWVDTGFRFWMNRDGATSSSWVRVTIRQDAVNGYWDVFLNGKMFLANIAFKDRGLLPGQLVLFGGSLASDVFVDDLKVWTSNPVFTDTDLDGMEDAFETAHQMDSGVDDRELTSSDPNLSRIQYYLNDSHNWFSGQWAQQTTDTDGDGMPDWWEVFFGLDPNSNTDGAQDRDGDRVSNLHEYQLGTSPAGSYVVKDLGGIMDAFDTNGYKFQPLDINNRGEVIGYYAWSSSVSKYVKWSPTEGVSIIFANTETVQPRGLLSINDSSQVVGYYKPLTPGEAPLFWWQGQGINAVALPATFNEVNIIASLGTINYPPDSWVDDWGWFDNHNPPAFEPETNEYVYSYDLWNNFFYSEFGESYAVNLERTEWLTYTSSFLGLTHRGELIGTYSADGGYVEEPVPFVGFDSEFAAARRGSSGVYRYQTPILGAVESYSQNAENDWNGTAYQPVDVNRFGELLGHARQFDEGNVVNTGVFLQAPGAAPIALAPPPGSYFEPLKISGLGHALLKIANASPAQFGIFGSSGWAPLPSSFPAGISFTPVAVDERDVVVGNTSGTSFGPALLTGQGIVRLSNTVAVGEVWDFDKGTIKAVNDRGVMVGVAPWQGDRRTIHCFLMWREDDQDGDGLPDDWERRIVADNPTDNVASIWDVRIDDDFDGDGLSNAEEFWNQSDPVLPSASLAEEVGLTVFNRLE